MPNDAVVEAALLPCPFCGGKADLTRKGTYRQSMIITCRDCGACVESGDVVGATNPSSYRWNHRRVASDLAQVRAALIDATAHLVGAASAYRKHAARHRSVGRAVADPFFSTRVKDFDKAVARAREALAILERAGVR